MSALSGFLTALVGIASSPLNLVMIVFCTLYGIIMGAIPGVSAFMALILFLPLTYRMSTELALVCLYAVMTGGVSGGLISSILLNIPGTPGAAVTCFDGYPLAKKGEAGKALGVGIMVSFIGGMFSYLVLIFLAPVVAKVALKFGPFEYWAISIFSLSMIITVSGKSLAKGLISAMIGMMLATSGPAPIDTFVRYNFGLYQLNSGIGFQPVLTGMFAAASIYRLAMNRDSASAGIIKCKKFPGFGMPFKEYWKRKFNILRSAIIGTYIGILPGVGSSTASLISYSTAKNASKDPDSFGTGNIDGVIASETSNNAVIGGAQLTMLTLGIPGNNNAAIMLSCLAIHGITTGPMLFQNDMSLIYSIFAILILANIAMLVIERFLIPLFTKILEVPDRIVMVIVIMMCYLGTYNSQRSVTDLILFAVSGLVGYLLEVCNIQLAPVILGFILGPITERYMRQALMVSKLSVAPLFQRPISLTFIIIAVIAFAHAFYQRSKRKRQDQDA